MGHNCDDSAGTTPDTVASQPPQPYSVYAPRAKWAIVAMVAMAGLFSPLPANIYFPAIPTLSNVFHQSTENLNLTVTVYLAFQGISPMLWGPLSDRWGRRPIFIVCFVILVIDSIGLALNPPSAFWLLLLLRCLQACGCASTIALGAGVIGDISTPEERGGYFAMFNLGPMLAPCIGPAVGGALSDHLGWRSIFWFLAIVASVCLLFIILFLPETLRALVGNGSIQPGSIYRPLVPVITGSVVKTKRPIDVLSDAVPKQRVKVNPFTIFTYPDILITLLFTGVVYAVNYTITATVSSSFSEVYVTLSDTALGLCYLASGAGMLVGSTLTGKLLDRQYRSIKAKFIQEHGPESSWEAGDFPSEYARLRTMPAHLAIFVAGVAGWGWALDKKAHIAVPLVLQVILGYTSISILNTTMTLMIDILHTRSSGATACTNLVRCSLAAMLVSVIDKATRSLGRNWTYILLAGLCLLLLPLMYVEIKIGPRIRRKRILRSKEEKI